MAVEFYRHKNGAQFVWNVGWSIWEFHVHKMWRLGWHNEYDGNNHNTVLDLGPFILGRRYLPKRDR